NRAFSAGLDRAVPIYISHYQRASRQRSSQIEEMSLLGDHIHDVDRARLNCPRVSPRRDLRNVNHYTKKTCVCPCMSTEIKKQIRLEIAHVLFIDIVGYSKLLINQQRALLDTLNTIVRASDEFRTGDAGGRLIKIPTGDGMALVFYDSPETPVECALEINRALKEHPELRLRMGVHSGPVSGVIDVNEQSDVAGAGINVAQRVMDCGDAGHILLSKHVAEDLEEYEHWQPHLHDLGEIEVKHGVRVSIVNLYNEELGNPEMPEKFKQATGKKKTGALVFGERTRPSVSQGWLIGGMILVLGTIVIGLLSSSKRSSRPAISSPA